jgi:hypothetical protein
MREQDHSTRGPGGSSGTGSSKCGPDVVSEHPGSETDGRRRCTQEVGPGRELRGQRREDRTELAPETVADDGPTDRAPDRERKADRAVG